MAARKAADAPPPYVRAADDSDGATEPAAGAPVSAAQDQVAQDRTPGTAESTAPQPGKTSAETKSNMDKAAKTVEELMSFSQGNLEALVKSGQIWAAGVQDLGKQFAASAQAQVDHTMATLKAMATAKSFKEAVELQSSLTRTSVEKAVAETGKLTDASLKLAEQAFAPLTARVALAAERFGRVI